MNQTQKIEVRFGVFAPKPSEQTKYGTEHHDLDAEAITRLLVRGLLTEPQAHSARTRLFAAIRKNAAEQEQPR